MNRRRSNFLLILIFIFSTSTRIWGQLPGTPQPKPFVVLELFTSQGCSSCPPADNLLGKIIDDAKKNNKPIFAMEYHVDYWNKYGWKDPYSSFKYTLRQRNYINVLPETQAYTPQLMVNGGVALVGSDETQVSNAVTKELKSKGDVGLEVRYKGTANDTMLVYYIVSKPDKNYFLKIVMVEKTVANAVSKGENAGKTLQHHNVVVVYDTFDLNVQTGTVKVPLNKIIPGKNYQLIAFVQHRQTMRILGAASSEFF
jgi:hypothetical protein